MPSKIKYKDLVKIMPELKKLTKLPSKQRIKKLLKKNSRDQDLVCKCVSVGLKSLNKQDFPKKQMKNLESEKEYLRFISDYSKCSKNKKKCLISKRNRALKKTGKGIGIILSTLLPILTSIIAKKV